MSDEQFKLIEEIHVAFVRELQRLLRPLDGSRALRGRSVDHTNNLLFRCAIPMLKVYGDDERWEDLYRSSMRDLLLPGAKNQ